MLFVSGCVPLCKSKMKGVLRKYRKFSDLNFLMRPSEKFCYVGKAFYSGQYAMCLLRHYCQITFFKVTCLCRQESARRIVIKVMHMLM
jgi:hypothetical protein